MAHSPLEFLYERFTAYVEDRRREPRDDVLTGLATATFPDGSTPEVIDVVRVAANLFAAGQETTVRLLARRAAADRRATRSCSSSCATSATRIPNFVEETLRFESPVKGDFRLARVPTTVGGVDIPAGTTVMVLNGAANRDPRQLRGPRPSSTSTARTRASTSRSATASTPARARRWRAPRASVSIERLLDRMADIRISEDSARSGRRPALQVRADVHPARTASLHLEFTPGRLSR